MSWQAYVDQQLVGSQCMDDGAIIGLDGNIWAKSAKFALKGGEGAKLVQNFKDTAIPLASGIMYNGVKYMCIRADATATYGKKGNTGIVLCKCGKCIVAGVYGEKFQTGQATNAVERLAAYLRENNY